MRINGIGTTILGIRRTKNSNTATATEWLTFLFLPLIPFNRYEIEFGQQGYKIVKKLPLLKSEILLTYLNGLILVPVIMLAPLFLVVPENWASLHLPENLAFFYFLLCIVWIVIFFLLILFGYEKQLKYIKQ